MSRLAVVKGFPALTRVGVRCFSVVELSLDVVRKLLIATVEVVDSKSCFFFFWNFQGCCVLDLELSTLCRPGQKNLICNLGSCVLDLELLTLCRPGQENYQIT